MGFSLRVIWPWGRGEAKDCVDKAEFSIDGYHGRGPLFYIDGEVKTRDGYWRGHREAWEWEDRVKGGDPDPIGNSLFVQTRRSSKVHTVTPVDIETGKETLLSPKENRTLVKIFTKAKNRWRWF